HGLSTETKDEIARIPGKRVRYWHLPARYALAGSLTLAVLMVGLAQTAGPGNPLYGIRRGTEQIRAWIQPDYTETLVDERKAEVEKLIEQNAAPEKIEQAERLYEDTRSRSNQLQQDTRPQESNKDKDHRRRDKRSRSDDERSDRRGGFTDWLRGHRR